MKLEGKKETLSELKELFHSSYDFGKVLSLPTKKHGQDICRYYCATRTRH